MAALHQPPFKFQENESLRKTISRSKLVRNRVAASDFSRGGNGTRRNEVDETKKKILKNTIEGLRETRNKESKEPSFPPKSFPPTMIAATDHHHPWSTSKRRSNTATDPAGQTLVEEKLSGNRPLGVPIPGESINQGQRPRGATWNTARSTNSGNELSNRGERA